MIITIVRLETIDVDLILLQEELIKTALQYSTQESVSLSDLAMLGLETEEAGWTEEDGEKEELANSVKELLLEKADMMSEYFSVIIDKKGMLKSLPILLGQFSKDSIKLHTQRKAKECFLVFQTSTFPARPECHFTFFVYPPKSIGQRNSLVSTVSAEKRQSITAR